MGRYIDWPDVVDRYQTIASVGDTKEVGSAYIQYAEAEVDARLACAYTVPFSNNNLTAKDLAIDITFLKVSRTRDKTYDKVKVSVDERIKMLITNKAKMVDLSGTIISASVGRHADVSDAIPVYTDVGCGSPRQEGDIIWTSSENY